MIFNLASLTPRGAGQRDSQSHRVVVGKKLFPRRSLAETVELFNPVSQAAVWHALSNGCVPLPATEKTIKEIHESQDRQTQELDKTRNG